MNSNVKNILEWVYCIIIAFILALLFRYFIGTPTIVRQRSMYPTLQENQRLLLNRTFRITKSSPKKGDIITFEAPSKSYESYEVDQSNPIAIYDNEPQGIFSKFVYNVLELTKQSYIKRVIALEGDHVKIADGNVYINGTLLEEDYLQPDVITESTEFNDFIVPEGYVFAMGDNRTKSTDCRKFGCIPLDKIEGIVVLRFWPFNTFGKVK
jgi:signal peptidase I